MQEHFDVDGNPTGHTVVTRASLWNDSARARAIKLIEHEDSIDGFTRLPVQEAFTEQPFVVDHSVNYAEIQIARHKKTVKAEAAEAAKKAGGKLADDWDTGFHYHVRPATAAEIAEAEAQRAH